MVQDYRFRLRNWLRLDGFAPVNGATAGVVIQRANTLSSEQAQRCHHLTLQISYEQIAKMLIRV